jgi:type IV pilus assembly protein PilE
MKLNQHSGFTLTEFLITVTLVAIVASMAWPKFSDFTSKNQQKDAFRILDSLRTQQKRFHLVQDTYAPVAGGSVNGMANINAIFGTDISANGYTVTMSSNSLLGSNAKYTVQVTSASGNSWYVTQSMPEDIGTGAGPVNIPETLGNAPIVGGSL